MQGSGIVSACYPGACSEFHLGSFGVECTMRENKLGGNCSSCSPGMYLPARTTYSTCLACLPGKHAPNLGMAECTTCSAGRYQDAMQGDICKTCPKGKYSNNSIACIKVPPGSYPINCFSDDHGCATTKLCPEGTFCNGTTPKPVPFGATRTTWPLVTVPRGSYPCPPWCANNRRNILQWHDTKAGTMVVKQQNFVGILFKVLSRKERHW